MTPRVLLVCALVAACLCLLEVSAERSEGFPLSTLLEHTAIASDKFAPTPRNRLEKLKLTQEKRMPEFLGAKVDQIMYHGSDAQVDEGRSAEPTSNHFGEALIATKAAAAAETERAPRKVCEGDDCSKGPERDPPVTVPPPAAPALPPKKSIKETPEHRPFPEPPAPENPLPTPPMPDCGGMCNPDAKDPVLARIPAPPLGDAEIAAVGLEGTVLAKVTQKLKNREGWLRAQKLWLSKATEAADTVRREIELAEFTKDAVASELQQLKAAQDQLSLKYKADRLKWSYKDKKITYEQLLERLHELEHAKADVAHQIREAKDEVTILENTLGPPSQQVQISPAELEDPLAFLADVVAEHNYNSYD
jgi:hypothetical protein